MVKGEIETLEMRQFRAERESLEADIRIVGSADRDQTSRAEFLRARVKTLEQELAAKRALLARRTARREQLETERRSAQAAYEATLTRLRDIRSAVGYRGERLKLVDPGVIPENPVTPHGS